MGWTGKRKEPRAKRMRGGGERKGATMKRGGPNLEAEKRARTTTGLTNGEKTEGGKKRVAKKSKLN